VRVKREKQFSGRPDEVNRELCQTRERRIDAANFPAHTSRMAKMLHPLAEVFGFPTTDMSANANRHRTKRLGGAVLRVVEGNYPTDFQTREEQVFQIEDEAVKAAELFRQNVVA
jgi:hypothetical protein